MEKVLDDVIPVDYISKDCDVILNVTFCIKGRRRRDIDNMLKALCDSLQPRLILDDNQIIEIHAKKIRSHADATYISICEATACVDCS
jgi:Holliday junction resolvase RusA-like endonuclease